MITAAQCRAARGLLGWSQQKLADEAGFGIINRPSTRTGRYPAAARYAGGCSTGTRARGGFLHRRKRRRRGFAPSEAFQLTNVLKAVALLARTRKLTWRSSEGDTVKGAPGRPSTVRPCSKSIEEELAMRARAI